MEWRWALRVETNKFSVLHLICDAKTYVESSFPVRRISTEAPEHAVYYVWHHLDVFVRLPRQ
jgi:hypothetical protein